ncbi:uncharacterized protein LOC132756178 [Ruditapes philippinarum]|uniref:uncharacterized protein LOC132756178 n=1 Tax=Ruditapes philippinarum TaxID=129788 RepID=UPI00295B82EF|nr:uncharacterized protein LOC132756178 [Ruditapes philippinarum]
MSDKREDVENSYEKAKSTGSVDDQYKVFIVYNTETDEIETACKVANALTKRSVSCVFDVEDHQAFPIGEPVTENIVKWIENSEKTLVILSKDSIKSTCQLLQTILALDKCKKKNIFCLRLLLHGVDENEIQFLKRDFLQSVPCRKLDFDQDGWEKCLVSYINEDIPIPDILPVGSLAHGLVFSHFNGYYKYILPVLQKELEKTDVYKNNPGRVSVRYYLLIPSTCEVVSSLSGCDSKNKITIEEETILKLEKEHVGKDREFNITIYRLKKGDEDPYYFFADCPNVLNAIHTMSKEKMAKVDVQLQVARFYHTMNEVIHHTKNEFCQDVAVELLPYNAVGETRQCVLYDAIKRNLCKTDSKQQCTPHRLRSPNAKQPENDVTILCHPDCSNDLLHADKIEEELVKNNLKVVKDYERGNESEQTIKPAKWYILVVSKTTFNSTNLTAFKCAACLDNSITDDSVSVLPVLVGVEPCEIPAMIRWVTMISVNDHNYLEAILQIVKGQPVRMQDKIPCGDVATGLAWACYINYLSITMEPGLRDRIVKLMKSKAVMCDCIEKLFIIVPLSCKTEPKLAEKANETSETPVIQYVGKSEVVEKEMAGQHRTFYIHMYKYTDPETENSVCFMSEYCAAINNIKEMGNLPFSGITREDMSRQCEKFVEVMEDIMNRKAVKDKLGDISKLVHFVFYDDSKQTLIEAIKEQIIGGDYNMICRKDHYHYFLRNILIFFIIFLIILTLLWWFLASLVPSDSQGEGTCYKKNTCHV